MKGFVELLLVQTIEVIINRIITVKVIVELKELRKISFNKNFLGQAINLVSYKI